MVTALDRKYGSKGPFNSLSKLSDLYNKCGSVSKMTWVLKLTWLCLKHEKLDLSDFAVKKLTSQAGGTKVGTLELMLLKHKLLQYLLNFFLDSKNFEHKDLLRACFAAPDTYEEKYLLADKTFMSSWSKSSSKLADLIENCCFAFNSQETPSLKTAVKMNKTPEELLQEYNPFKSEVEEILKCLAEKRALNPVNALVYDDGEEYEEEGIVWPHDQPAPEVTSRSERPPASRRGSGGMGVLRHTVPAEALPSHRRSQEEPDPAGAGHQGCEPGQGARRSVRKCDLAV